jgi:hypothetical protein
VRTQRAVANRMVALGQQVIAGVTAPLADCPPMAARPSPRSRSARLARTRTSPLAPAGPAVTAIGAAPSALSQQPAVLTLSDR